jgi:hypothetical protein
MSNFTIVTTPDDDQVFVLAKNQYNSENGTSLTNAQYFDLAIRPALRRFVEEQLAKTEALDRSAVVEAWKSADAATRAAVKTALGL